MDSQTAAYIRQVVDALRSELSSVKQQLAAVRNTVTPQDEINSIPGRRVFYALVGTQDFTATQDGLRGNPINMTVSQDGPFIMTHYPVCMWRPNLPTNATQFGFWRPVSMFPLPVQQNAAAGTMLDIINISYEIVDGGTQRNFQNLPVPPLLSRPDELHDLPVHTLFAPNTTVQFIPTYQDITFGSPATPSTGGTLVVALPGMRIVNM